MDTFRTAKRLATQSDFNPNGATAASRSKPGKHLLAASISPLTQLGARSEDPYRYQPA
jgi:hypothetical protein